MPFLLLKRNGESTQEVDRRTRWDVLLAALTYSILWRSKFWEKTAANLAHCTFDHLSLKRGPTFLGGTRALGRQWRIDAGLNPDHELVTSGFNLSFAILSTRRCHACSVARAG